jgi:hypothetical protein
MVRTSRNRITAAVRCNRVAGMERTPPDPIRDLAIEIVEIFAGLLREEVYERIKGRLEELKGQQ